MPRPETGSLVMWQSLGGLQPSPLNALARPRRSWSRDIARSYSSPSNTNKHNWCPLSFIFLATWFIKRETQYFLLESILWRGIYQFNNVGSSSYLRVRYISNIAIVDFQKPISILKATARCHPSWHNVSDYMTLASPLHPQMEAIGLPFLSFKNAQTRAGCWHGVWAGRDKKVIEKCCHTFSGQSFLMLRR